MIWTLQQFRDLAASVGFPDPILAGAIARAECGGDTEAENIVPPSKAAALGQRPEWSVGVFQINNCMSWSGDSCASTRYDRTRLLDPTYNAHVAYAISGGGTNWKPWGAYTDGRYKHFLPAGYVPYIPTPIRPPTRKPAGAGNPFITGAALALLGFAGWMTYDEWWLRKHRPSRA